MAYLLDSNILIYSQMDAMPEHGPVFSWLSKTLSEAGTTVLVTETSLLSFLRITTNLKIFDPPLPLNSAASFIVGFLGDPSTYLYRSSEEHFLGVAKFMKKHDFAGNLVMDAHLAVAAIETGATLVTCDTDFKKIPYMKLLNPLVDAK